MKLTFLATFLVSAAHFLHIFMRLAFCCTSNSYYLVRVTIQWVADLWGECEPSTTSCSRFSQERKKMRLAAVYVKEGERVCLLPPESSMMTAHYHGNERKGSIVVGLHTSLILHFYNFILI